MATPLEFLMDNYNRYVGLAHSIVRDHHDAEDVVQCVAEGLYRKNSATYDGVRDLDPWLCAVVRNQSISFTRRRKMITGNFEGGAYLEHPLDTLVETERNEFERDVIWQLWRELGPELRWTFFLRAVGLKYVEIARGLDIPKATVGSHINRAKQKLTTMVKVRELTY